MTNLRQQEGLSGYVSKTLNGRKSITGLGVISVKVEGKKVLYKMSRIDPNSNIGTTKYVSFIKMTPPVDKEPQATMVNVGYGGLIPLVVSADLSISQAESAMDGQIYKLKNELAAKGDKLWAKTPSTVTITYAPINDEMTQSMASQNMMVRPASSSGCFIATAAYGTPLAREIDILRHWRDTELTEKAPGRAFVRGYYLVSPPIAHVIEASETLKKAVRRVLNILVRYMSRPVK